MSVTEQLLTSPVEPQTQRIVDYFAADFERRIQDPLVQQGIDAALRAAFQKAAHPVPPSPALMAELRSVVCRGPVPMMTATLRQAALAMQVGWIAPKAAPPQGA
jgi:hypothetical protein